MNELNEVLKSICSIIAQKEAIMIDLTFRVTSE